MATYYRHERSEDINLLYTFKCEQCGKSSGDLFAHIVGENAIYNSNFKNIKDDKNQKLCAEAHQNLVRKLKEIYYNAKEKSIFSTEFKDICPHCKARQSWGVGTLKKTLFALPKTIFIMGIIVTIAAFIACYNKDLEYLNMGVVYSIAGISVMIALGSLVFNFVRLKIREEKILNNSYCSEPKIDWKCVEKLLKEK